MSEAWHLVAGSFVAGTPLVVIELLSRIVTLPAELSRKSTHVLSALAVILLTTFCTLYQIAFIALLFMVLLGATRSRHLWKSLYGVSRDSWGEITFPAGVLVAALCAPDTAAFSLIVLIVGVSDTLASLVGQHFHSPALPLVKDKSVAGSLACLESTLLITILFTGGFGWDIVGFSLAITFAEAIGVRGSDNLTVPIIGTAYLVVAGLG